MDWCGGATDVRGSYASMGKALNESGRHMALNRCRGDVSPGGWIDAFAQSWRVTADHSGLWSQPGHGIKQGIATAMKIPRNSTGRPYGWNDLARQTNPSTPPRGLLLEILAVSLHEYLLEDASSLGAHVGVPPCRVRAVRHTCVSRLRRWVVVCLTCRGLSRRRCRTCCRPAPGRRRGTTRRWGCRTSRSTRPAFYPSCHACPRDCPIPGPLVSPHFVRACLSSALNLGVPPLVISRPKAGYSGCGVLRAVRTPGRRLLYGLPIPRTK